MLRACAGALFVVLVTASAGAQAVPGTDAMDPVSCPKDVATLGTCYSTRLPSGAFLLVGTPKTWNGDLVVHAHGGPAVAPPTADYEAGNNGRYLSVAMRLGYAWIGSSYRQAGYGAQFAAADVDEARRFFVAHFPKPRRTLLHGTSYGGLVSTVLLDRDATANPDGSPAYDGMLLNSPVAAGAFFAYEFRADLRAVYQFYCRNLPRPDEPAYPGWMGLPRGSALTQGEINARIDDCTGVSRPAAMRTPEQASHLADILGVTRIPDEMLLRHMQAATFVFRDIAERITNGRSWFSNVGVQYRGSSNDAALNARIERVTADPAAVAALKADGVSSGRLTVPVVSIHSRNDPQVPMETEREYQRMVEKAGAAGRLVQAYTVEAAHAQQSAPELAAALTALAGWVDAGTKPAPASIAEACERLKAILDGPCRWQPDFEPSGFETKFARRR